MKNQHQVTVHFPLPLLEKFDALREKKEKQNPGSKVSRASLILHAVELLLLKEDTNL